MPDARNAANADCPGDRTLILMLRCMDVSCVGTGRGRRPRRRGSAGGPGRYRAAVDPAVKAVEIVAFLYRMETPWLFDPSVPLTEVF